MAIYHLVTNIQGLLRNYNDERLGKFFDMDGQEARKELQSLLDQGDVYIGSDTCTHFDPKLGCRCRFYNENGSLIENAE